MMNSSVPQNLNYQRDICRLRACLHSLFSSKNLEQDPSLLLELMKSDGQITCNLVACRPEVNRILEKLVGLDPWTAIGLALQHSNVVRVTYSNFCVPGTKDIRKVAYLKPMADCSKNALDRMLREQRKQRLEPNREGIPMRVVTQPKQSELHMDEDDETKTTVSSLTITTASMDEDDQPLVIYTTGQEDPVSPLTGVSKDDVPRTSDQKQAEDAQVPSLLHYHHKGGHDPSTLRIPRHFDSEPNARPPPGAAATSKQPHNVSIRTAEHHNKPTAALTCWASDEFPCLPKTNAGKTTVPQGVTPEHKRGGTVAVMTDYKAKYPISPLLKKRWHAFLKRC